MFDINFNKFNGNSSNKRQYKSKTIITIQNLIKIKALEIRKKENKIKVRNNKNNYFILVLIIKIYVWLNRFRK